MFSQLKKKKPIAKPRSVDQPCASEKIVFYKGTRIATSSGWQKVEDLQKGQSVRTADNHEELIADLGHEALRFSASRDTVRDWPVILPAGAVGNAEKILVSPNLRLVIENPNAKSRNQPKRVSVRAETLIGYRGIARAPLYVDLEQVAVSFSQAATLILEGGVLTDVPSTSGDLAVPPLDDRASRAILHKLRRADLRRSN